jgi:glucosamine kinase
LLALAETVAAKLFPGAAAGAVKAGLSGPILTHPVVTRALAARSSLALRAVTGTPIDGIQRLLARA